MGISLKRKFLLPIFIGAALLILSATVSTNFSLHPELRSQLHKRAELMLITIRAAAEINPAYQDLRLALEEITLHTSGVYGITLATLNPTIIWASSTHPDADIDRHTSNMLELLETSAENHLFGHFIHDNGDIIVIAPFKQFENPLTALTKTTAQFNLPTGVKTTNAYTLAPDAYEGILYLRFNWAETATLANTNLLRQVLAFSAVITLMLILATIMLYRVILKPLSQISRTILSQKSGQPDARTKQLADDEIGYLDILLTRCLMTFITVIVY